MEDLELEDIYTEEQIEYLFQNVDEGYPELLEKLEDQEYKKLGNGVICIFCNKEQAEMNSLGCFRPVDLINYYFSALPILVEYLKKQKVQEEAIAKALIDYFQGAIEQAGMEEKIAEIIKQIFRLSYIQEEIYSEE